MVIEKVKNEIIKLIDEIEAIKNVTQNKNYEKILSELRTMSEKLTPRMFVPSYPKAIIDSWDYNDKLGQNLLYVYNLYMKL